ncbi:MAG: hypothetical protein IIW13_01120 [Paludibacteraceae bacterium]|nr:hypothetical protein [Paludibacteraceae bacterium]
MKKVFLAIAAIVMSVAVNAATLVPALANGVGASLADSQLENLYQNTDYYSTAVGVTSITLSGGAKIVYNAAEADKKSFSFKADEYVRVQVKKAQVVYTPQAGEAGKYFVMQVRAKGDSGPAFSSNAVDLGSVPGPKVTDPADPAKQIRPDQYISVAIPASGDVVIDASEGFDFMTWEVMDAAPTGVENASADAKEVKFFNVNGQEVAADAEGFVFGTDGSKKFNK